MAAATRFASAKSWSGMLTVVLMHQSIHLSHHDAKATPVRQSSALNASTGNPGNRSTVRPKTDGGSTGGHRPILEDRQEDGLRDVPSEAEREAITVEIHGPA